MISLRWVYDGFPNTTFDENIYIIVLFGGFLWSLINVNLHLTTDNKIGLGTANIYSKLPDFT